MNRAAFFITLLFLQPCLAEKTISACGHPNYPPWNWTEKNKIIGVCVEVTKELFKKIGYQVDFKASIPWTRCQLNINNGTTDVNICAFKNIERLKYSKILETPMGLNENAVFVNKGKIFNFNEWADLNNKTIGMVMGVSVGESFDQFLAKNTSVFRVKAPLQLFKMLQLERIDAFIMGRNAGRLYAQKLGFTEVVDLKKSVLVGKLYISMSKKSKHLNLLPKIEKQMKEENYNLWINKLLKKYSKEYISEH